MTDENTNAPIDSGSAPIPEATLSRDRDTGQTAGWLRKLIALALITFACYSLFRSYGYRAPRHVDVSALQLGDLQGNMLPLSSVAHRPVVLNFWAPWCPPCLKEMPWLASLQRRHPEVTVIGIEYDPETVAQAVVMQESQPAGYALAAPSARTLKEFGQISALPTTLYISRSGVVVHTVTGVVPESVMDRYVADSIQHK